MEKESEIATELGNILLDILPDNAESITAESEAAVGYAATEFILTGKDGGTFSFPADDSYPDDAADAVNQNMKELWKAMTADGQDPWYSVRFTVHRDGHFDADFSYEFPEGY